MAGLCPQYINIRRGSYVMAIIGVCIQYSASPQSLPPWQISSNQMEQAMAIGSNGRKVSLSALRFWCYHGSVDVYPHPSITSPVWCSASIFILTMT